MSNDLISRSALIERLNKRKNTCVGSLNKVVIEMIIGLVENQPIAYDVDEVVKQLAEKSRFIDDINEHGVNCIACVIGQKDAIEIVEKGGME